MLTVEEQVQNLIKEFSLQNSDPGYTQDHVISILIERLSNAEAIIENVKALVPDDPEEFENMWDGLGLYDIVEKLCLCLDPNNKFIIHDSWDGEE